jgi:hypothetical protein
MNRDERIENYYQQSAWDLAERIVDLEDRLDEQRERAAFLYALEAVGVDNWEGYSTARQLHEGEISEDGI